MSRAEAINAIIGRMESGRAPNGYNVRMSDLLSDGRIRADVYKHTDGGKQQILGYMIPSSVVSRQMTEDSRAIANHFRRQRGYRESF